MRFKARLYHPVEILKAVLSAQRWRICSCTTRLMLGWRESIRTFHGAGMQMMDWCTAERKPKLLL